MYKSQNLYISSSPSLICCTGNRYNFDLSDTTSSPQYHHVITQATPQCHSSTTASILKRHRGVIFAHFYSHQLTNEQYNGLFPQNAWLFKREVLTLL